MNSPKKGDNEREFTRQLQDGWPRKRIMNPSKRRAARSQIKSRNQEDGKCNLSMAKRRIVAQGPLIKEDSVGMKMKEK